MATFLENGQLFFSESRYYEIISLVRYLGLQLIFSTFPPTHHSLPSELLFLTPCYSTMRLKREFPGQVLGCTTAGHETGPLLPMMS